MSFESKPSNLSSIPTHVMAALAKLPSVDHIINSHPNEKVSFDEFLKQMCLVYDWTHNKYKVISSDATSFSSDDELVYISQIMKTFISYEMNWLIDQNLSNMKLEDLEEEVNKENSKINESVSPKPISDKERHCLAVVQLKASNQYILVRTQDKSLQVKLKNIDEKSGIVDKVIWRDVPHAIDSANCVKKFLRDNNFYVDGLHEKVTWPYGLKSLEKIVEVFRYSRAGKEERDAEKILQDIKANFNE